MNENTDAVKEGFTVIRMSRDQEWAALRTSELSDYKRLLFAHVGTEKLEKVCRQVMGWGYIVKIIAPHTYRNGDLHKLVTKYGIYVEGDGAKLPMQKGKHLMLKVGDTTFTL